MVTRVLLAAILGVVSACATGCGDSGPKLYSVKGKVSVDGKPASDATVFFHRKGRENPNEPVPYGKCGPDGSFALTTSKEGDGAQAGEYVVTVVWPDMSKAPDGNGGRPDLLRGAYDKAAKSAIKATVEAKDNQVPEITLTIPKAPAPKEPTGGIKTDK
ncbi:Uncharacterized protein OS=Singulisphaera acidiphila (strain ATCC BAA-1392 / DSM 18658 / VKM B-2454 / MOB10) GN=Sinac_3752 PE=4 SV=1 [Gemmata massiliana]|uniref:Carboxypeptidase regulatory-like domain-containing protein n=1 Tax=Gemmata massiliana TaxID=1210884 RepID=A0A6P2D6C6_9BACT|nr:hypothetical protein [Gemmata massiliana]VTR96553.1 Uncharacterized protein OS=Singulisphaera acidiphila (strain ATCC BAA-1392 / DSM 18658 / VKM B-2454 / MOB10) GN=Sinac_3752 PE=4 SV=1 [Gemmata massiliana]